MKRGGPIKRKTPMKRTPMQRRYRGVDIGEADRRVVRGRGCAMRSQSECWGPLHVHHILPRSLGGPDDPSNLMCLCARHHDWVHGHPTDAKKLGALRGTGDK